MSISFTGTVVSGGAFVAFGTNETENGVFAGYANAALLAAGVASYKLTAYGAIGPTSDGALNIWNGSSWVPFNSFSPGGDLGGTSSSQTVIGLTGTAGTLGMAAALSTIGYNDAATAPVFRQDARTTNAAPQPLTLRTQQGAAAATGANRTAGAMLLDIPAPTNGGASYGTIGFGFGGTAAASVCFNGTLPSITMGVTPSTVTAGGMALPYGGAGDTPVYAVSWRNSTNTQNIGALCYTKEAGEDRIKLNAQSSDGVTARRGSALYLDADDQLWVGIRANARGFINLAPDVTTLGSAITQLDALLTAPQIKIGQLFSNTRPKTFSLLGGQASSSATGTNRDGTEVLVMPGDPTDANGRRRAFGILDGMGGHYRSFAGDIDAAAAQASWAHVLYWDGAAPPTATNIPAGDGICFVGTATTAPAPATVFVGGVAIYVDPADGILKSMGPAGVAMALSL